MVLYTFSIKNKSYATLFIQESDLSFANTESKMNVLSKG